MIAATISLPASAQFTSGDQGDGGRQTSSTGHQNTTDGNTDNTSNQRYSQSGLGGATTTLRTGMGIGQRYGLAPVFGGGGRNGLPQTRLDSFVKEAGGHAWHIYGDEGVYSIPPFFEFTPIHRIERGITGRRASGITTGHGSPLPPSWGGDEFVDTEGFTQAGSPYPNRQVPFEAFLPPDLSNMMQGNSLYSLPGMQNVGLSPNGAQINGGRGSVQVGPGGVTGIYNTPLGNVTGGGNRNGGSVNLGNFGGFSWP